MGRVIAGNLTVGFLFVFPKLDSRHIPRHNPRLTFFLSLDVNLVNLRHAFPNTDPYRQSKRL
jgi:hypothetical protein